MRCRQTIVRWLGSFMLLIWMVGILVIPQPTALALTSPRKSPQVSDVVEVSPPETIQKLRSKIDQYQPQVKILSPAADQLLKDDTVSVRFEVKDLPVFKDATLGLGPHLHVFLDNQLYQEVYDLSQPLIFKELSPGTHTIRAVASRPWFESFKNPGAYTQVTFHVFTQTEENNPTAQLPLLTYGQPQGQIGAETVLLDFSLSNLGSFSANPSSNTPANWQALVSINGSSFYIDEWEPLYIKGLKPGKNWVRMELTDRRGRKIDNAFNDTIRVIEVQENNNDTLSRLIRGDLPAIDAGRIVDPNYKRPPVVKPPIPQPSPNPIPEAKETPLTSPKTETPKPEIVPAPILKQPDKVLAPAAPVSPPPSKPKSPVSKTKLPPTEPNKIQPDSGDRSAQRSLEVPAKSKADQKPEPKAENTKPSSPAQQPKPSEVKPTGKQPDQPTDTKLSPAKPPAAPKPVEKERKPSSPNSIPPAQTPTKPSNLEDQRPKKTDQTATQPPAAQSTPATKAIPQPSADPVKPKPVKEKSAPAIITKESTNKKSSREETTITAPGLSKQDKSVGKDEDSSLKTAITNFWGKIRPDQDATTPSTSTPIPVEKPVEKKETEAQQTKPKTSPGASSVPSKIGSLKSTTPPPTTPQAIKPKVPSTSTSKTSSKSTSINRPQSSASGPMTDKGQDALTKKSLEKITTQAKPPAVNSTQPEPSVFSSLRKRWQQQKQKLSTPTPKESTAIKTPPSPATAKTTDKTSVVKPAPNSTVQRKTSPAKTSTPKVTDKPSPTVKKTPNTDKKEAKPSNPTIPKAKTKPTESAFSSLRDRWQQQKQIVAPPAKQETTSIKPVAPKTIDKPSAVKAPAPNSSARRKTSTPKVTGTNSPTVQKTPSQNTDKQETTKPSTPAVPKAKAKQTESAFSSLRDRWQQQKQLVTPPAKQETTSTKPLTPKTTAKPNTVKPIPNSSVKKEIAPARTPAPKVTDKTSTTVKKTPSQNTDKKEVTKPSSASAAASPQKTESAFSSLRDRWQQQKKIVAPPVKQETKSTKAITSKTTAKPSTVKPIPNSSVKKETAPARTSAPKITGNSSPAAKKTPSQNKEVPKPSKPVVPKAKANKTESAFSSLRDRWQQQKKIVAPPAKQQTASDKPSLSKTIENQQQPTKAPTKTVQSKSAIQTPLPESKNKQSDAKPSTSKNSGFSSIRDRWQQQKKQLSPATQQQTTPARPQSSIDKTPAIKSAPNQEFKASPGKTDMNFESKAAQSQPGSQESEPMTFDPGVFYRRFLSKGETSTPKIQTQPQRVSPTPSP